MPSELMTYDDAILYPRSWIRRSVNATRHVFRELHTTNLLMDKIRIIKEICCYNNKLNVEK